MDLTLELASNRLFGGEKMEFIAHITSEDAQDIKVFACFRIELNEVAQKPEWVELFDGKVGAGSSSLPLLIDVPNGPFDYIGDWVRLRWSLAVMVRGTRTPKVETSEAVQVLPGAMVVASKTHLAPAPNKQVLRYVIFAAASLMTIGLSIFYGATTALFFGTIVGGGTLLIRHNNRWETSRGTGFRANFEERPLAPGDVVSVVIERTAQNDDREIRLEIAFLVDETGLKMGSDGNLQVVRSRLCEKTEDSVLAATERQREMHIQVPSGLPGTFYLEKVSVSWKLRLRAWHGESLEWQRLCPLAVAPTVVDGTTSSPVA